MSIYKIIGIIIGSISMFACIIAFYWDRIKGKFIRKDKKE